MILTKKQEEGLKIVATEVLTEEYLKEILTYILHKINYKKQRNNSCKNKTIF